GRRAAAGPARGARRPALRRGGAAAFRERADLLHRRLARADDRALPALVQVPAVRSDERIRSRAGLALGHLLRLHAELALGLVGRVAPVPRHLLPPLALLALAAHRRQDLDRR